MQRCGTHQPTLSRLDSLIASKIIAESNSARYQTRIDALRTSGAKSLFVIFSTSFNGRISIPSEFTSCEIVCCNGAEAHFDDGSTYCGIRLGLWNTRRTYTSPNLLPHLFVYFEMVEPDVPESPPPYQFTRNTRESESQRAAQSINSVLAKSAHDLDTNFLAWLAGIAGVATTGAVLIITNLNITAKGIYLSCQTATCNVTAIPFTVSASASAAVGSLGVGVAVAAAVYFIPWGKLATLMKKAWIHFVKLIGILWKFLGDAVDLLKRFIHTIVVVMAGIVDEATKCIAEFTAFLCKK